MKAAEDDKVDIMELLLKHRAEPDAMSRRGRTALSFAAAPSNERVENRRRESSMGALRLLLSLDEVWVLREDLSGMTARARAMKEHRGEAANLLAQAEGRCHTSKFGNESRQRERERSRRRGEDKRRPSVTFGLREGDRPSSSAQAPGTADSSDKESSADGSLQGDELAEADCESAQEDSRVAPDGTGTPTGAGRPHPPEVPPPPQPP